MADRTITSNLQAFAAPFFVAVYAGLLALLYTPAVKVMVSGWGKDDYNYCYLMPLVIPYLLWEKRSDLQTAATTRRWPGMVPLALGVLLFWAGELGGEYFTLYGSFWLALVGLCWLHLGWARIKVIGFPLLLIPTMFPFPNFLYSRLTLQLQLISSQLGVALIRLFGMSAYREGNAIDVGFTQLQVVEACSGLRYVIPLVVLGLLVAYFTRAPWWRRAAMVVVAAPLAIVINAARIALSALSHRLWGPEVAAGFFHDFSGWVIFMASLGILLLFRQLLMRFPRRVSGVPAGAGGGKEAPLTRPLPPDGGRGVTSDDAPPAPGGRGVTLDGDTPAPGGRAVTREDELTAPARRGMTSGDNAPPGPARALRAPDAPLANDGTALSWKRLMPHLAAFTAATVLLAGTFLASRTIEFREKIPIRRPLIQFPLAVGEWRGTALVMEQRFITELDLSDYSIVDYRNSAGAKVDFYVAYYESQRKGESIHSPETCLLGGGWLFADKKTVAVPLGGNPGRVLPVNRVVLEKPGQRLLTYFWFPQRGRVLVNAYQLKIFTFWDALTRQRTDGALVRVMTPIHAAEGSDKADARLADFVRQMVPILDEFLPGRDLG